MTDIYMKFVSQEKKNTDKADVRTLIFENAGGKKYFTAFVPFTTKEGKPIEEALHPDTLVTGEEYRIAYYKREREYEGRKRYDWMCIGVFVMTDEDKKRIMQQYEESGLTPEDRNMIADLYQTALALKKKYLD